MYASCNGKPLAGDVRRGAFLQISAEFTGGGGMVMSEFTGIDRSWSAGRFQLATRPAGSLSWGYTFDHFSACVVTYYDALGRNDGGHNCKVDNVAVLETGPTETPFPPYPTNWYRGGTPVVLGSVDPPSLYCVRRFRTSGGRQYVTVSGTVLNPMTGARDTLKLYTPWAALGFVGRSREWELPLAASMPESGWRGMCVVERRADDGYVVSDPLANTRSLSEFPIAGALTHLDGTVPELMDHSMGPQGAFVSPLDIRDPVQWITLAGGGGAAAAAEAAAAGVTLAEIGLVTGGTAIVAAAAYLAWKKGLLDLNLGGGCGMIDTIFGGGEHCDRPQELRPYTRSQTLFTDAEGRVITQTALPDLRWRTATAVAEVVIDPSRPQVGIDTVTALQSPPLTPAQRTELQELTSPNEEACRLNLLGVLNPFNMFKTLKCALMWAFVPPDTAWSSVAMRVRATFPLNIVSELNETREVGVGWFNDHLLGSGCWHLDLSRGHPDGLDDFAELDWRLPTPSDSGCAGVGSVRRTAMDDFVGDVYGFRWLFRLCAGLFVWWVLGKRLIRGFAPGADDELANVEPPF
jgi:hypothetical protein